jgi:hypothetical protein
MAVRQAITSPEVVASVRACCTSLPDALIVLKQWEGIILALVSRAVASVEPQRDDVSTSFVDFLRYVKVKTVPGGVPGTCAQ